MKIKKFLTGLSTAAIAILVSCSSGNETTSSKYYVSEQLFANGSVTMTLGSNLAMFKIAPTSRADSSPIACDDDGAAIVCDGTLYLDTNTLYVSYSYNVVDGVADLNINYIDGTYGSSVTDLYTNTYADILGLPWDNDYDKAAYDSVNSITMKIDMIAGLGQITTTYTTSGEMAGGTTAVQSSWVNYTVDK
ncbi:MAG: hypothetical protein R3Y56_10305 [Akkermansia sp.]